MKYNESTGHCSLYFWLHFLYFYSFALLFSFDVIFSFGCVGKGLDVLAAMPNVALGIMLDINLFVIFHY